MSKVFLHVGAGPIHLPEFINLDIDPSHNPDIVYDALKMDELYDANTFDALYLCHVFEHFCFPHDAITFLNVAHKILKPGGVLRLVVPDLELVAKAYASGSDLRFIYGLDFKGFYHKKESRAERLHYFVTAWQHQMTYDFDLLEMLLLDAGFQSVKRCPFSDSDTPELRGLDRFESESIVVEATK